MKEISSISQLDAFMEELRILSKCENRQIVKLISASLSGVLITQASKKSIVYIALSYAKFGELYKLIQETGPLSEPLVRTYFFQLLKSLEYLHASNIVHRDIKLENLLLDQDMRLILADFGCATRCRNISDNPVQFDTSIPVGSKEYNAPEIYTEKFYYGEKMDIFAAGACLFIMLFGHPPFREASSRDPFFKKLSRSDKSDYWSIYKKTHIPSDFKDLFEKMTEKDPNKRIELRSIYKHPWMAGPMFSAEELKSAMHDRIQEYLKVCWRQSREFFKAKKSSGSHKKISPRETNENTIKNDKYFKSCVMECAEIRRRLEVKIMPEIGKSKTPSPPNEIAILQQSFSSMSVSGSEKEIQEKAKSENDRVLSRK